MPSRNDEFFPLLERRWIPREFAPIGVMLKEHDMGRNFVKGLSMESIKTIKNCS
jgi:hemerythrin-like domain-containing protein